MLNKIPFSALKTVILFEELEIMGLIEKDDKVDLSDEKQSLRDEIYKCLTIDRLIEILEEHGYSYNDAVERLFKLMIELEA